MSDLIDRQAAIDALFELYEYQRDIDPTEAADLVRQGIYLAEKKIEQLPSVQPEIIRCKDCKYWKREENQVGEIDDDYFCAFGQNKSFREDFFCADGERGEE